MLLLGMSSSAIAVTRYYAGNAQFGGYGVKADIAWYVSDPANDHAAWVGNDLSTSGGKWIQAGLARGNYSAPTSYEEYFATANATYRTQYFFDGSGPQPWLYYRSYDVHRVGTNLWQAWIQGAARFQGYLGNDNAQICCALAELLYNGVSSGVYTMHRSCQYKATKLSGWSAFNQNHQKADPPFWSLDPPKGIANYDELAQ